MNPFETLGIQPGASEEDIKKAYRKKALETHPDRNLGDPEAAKKFDEVQKAYDSLTRPKQTPHFTPFDWFDQVFGNNDIFGFGNAQAKGADIFSECKLSFVESAKGCVKTVEFSKPESCKACKGEGSLKTHMCDACHGVGMVSMREGNMTLHTTCRKCRGSKKIILDPCKECNGRGKKDVTVKINVNFPPGLRAGDHVKLDGQGEINPNGNGDAYVVVKVEPHPLFSRLNDDLCLMMPITFAQAILGDTIDVPTLEGVAKLVVPPNVHAGTQLRMKEMGFVSPMTGRKGDCVVKIDIDTTIDSSAMDLVKSLRELEKKKPSSAMSKFKEKLRQLL